MAFKLNLSSTIKYPVDFSVVDATGNPRKHRVHFDFKRVKRDEVDQYDMKFSDEEKELSSSEKLDRDVDWLMKFVSGWYEVDINGGTEFNRENFRILLGDIPHLAGLFYPAFLEVNTGGAVPKN